jgi:hypothetical protein
MNHLTEMNRIELANLKLLFSSFFFVGLVLMMDSLSGKKSKVIYMRSEIRGLDYI